MMLSQRTYLAFGIYLAVSACSTDDTTPSTPLVEASTVSDAGSSPGVADVGRSDQATVTPPEEDANGTNDANVQSDVAAAIEAAPAKDATTDAAKRVPSFIVVVGSSTAAGFGLADPTTSWVQRYSSYLITDLPGSKVTNLAVSGYSTYQVLPTGTTNPSGKPAVDAQHNITAALALHPDAIIVNLPSNDANMGVPVEDSMTNLKTVAMKAHDANVAIWVTTSQPRALNAAGIALIIGLRDRIKQEFTDHALDFFTPLAAADGTPLPMYNQGDGIHPNAEGHRLLFETVRAADLPAALAAK